MSLRFRSENIIVDRKIRPNKEENPWPSDLEKGFLSSSCRRSLYLLVIKPTGLFHSIQIVSTEIQGMISWAKSHGLNHQPSKNSSTYCTFVVQDYAVGTFPTPLLSIEVDGNVLVLWGPHNKKTKVFGNISTLKRIQNLITQN